jgi:hypothetical protein
VTLGNRLAEASIDLAGAAMTTSPDGGLTWARGDRPFATVSADGSNAEFGLDPAVAEAALRTPDVSPSEVGPGWVRFAPAALDDRAIDRAVAWFASAHRRLQPRN